MVWRFSRGLLESTQRFQIRLDRFYLSHNGEIHLLQQLKEKRIRQIRTKVNSKLLGKKFNIYKKTNEGVESDAYK